MRRRRSASRRWRAGTWLLFLYLLEPKTCRCVVVAASGMCCCDSPVQVGTPVCVVVDTAASIPAFNDYKGSPKAAAAAAPAIKATPPSTAPPASPPAPAASSHPIPSNLLAGPAVMRLLHENPHINAAAIQGSGPKGRVLKGDVLAAIAGKPPAAVQRAAPPPSQAARPAAAAAGTAGAAAAQV
jgi:pyruvate dehydrogenase E2 component (dihydrolipoamide acetyltransferase)